MPFHWNQVTWSWLKPMPTGGTGKWRTGGRRNHMKWSANVVEGIPSYLMRNQWTGCLWFLHQNWLLLIAPTEGTPLPMIVCTKQARCTTTTLEEQTLEESETEEVLQSVNCLVLAQCQTGETTLGWMNKKLCAFIQIFSRASLQAKRWKVWCRGTGSVWTSMSAFPRQRYWSHWWGLKDMADHDFFNPTSLCSRDCKLTTQGVWNECTSPCINFWGDYSVLNTDAMKLLAFPMQGTPCHCYPTSERKTLLYRLTWNLSKNSQCEHIKLFRPPSMSNAWHKRQNTV